MLSDSPSRAQNIRESLWLGTNIQVHLNKSTLKNNCLCVSANDVTCLKHLPVQGIVGIMSVEHRPTVIFISAEKEQN